MWVNCEAIANGLHVKRRRSAKVNGKERKGTTHSLEIIGTSVSTAAGFVVCLPGECKVERKEERKCGPRQP